MVEISDSELLDTSGITNQSQKDVDLSLDKNGNVTKQDFVRAKKEDPLLTFDNEDGNTSEPSTPEASEDKKPYKKDDGFLSILNDIPSEDSEGAEPEEAPEAVEQAKAPKSKNRAQDRIRELNAKNHELAARLAAIEASLVQINTPPAQNNTDGGLTEPRLPDIPSPTNYPNGAFDADYVADLTSYYAQQALAQQENIAAERYRQAQEQQARDAYIAGLNTKLEAQAAKGREIFDDFDAVMFNDSNRMDFNTLEILLDADNGAEISYRLMKNPAEAARLMNLPIMSQMREIVKLDAAITNAKNMSKVSKAPPPISKFKSSASGTNTISPDTGNLADFEKLFYKKR